MPRRKSSRRWRNRSLRFDDSRDSRINAGMYETLLEKLQSALVRRNPQIVPLLEPGVSPNVVRKDLSAITSPATSIRSSSSIPGTTVQRPDKRLSPIAWALRRRHFRFCRRHTSSSLRGLAKRSTRIERSGVRITSFGGTSSSGISSIGRNSRRSFLDRRRWWVVSCLSCKRKSRPSRLM